MLFLICLPAYFFYLKYYPQGNSTNEKTALKITNNEDINSSKNLQSFNIYQTQIDDLKSLYEVKENIAKDLIEKRFTPPQITYDKFISVVNSCTDLFNNQVEVISDLINFSNEHTRQIDYEIESRINILKSIIEKIDSLTNELVLNIGKSKSEDDKAVENILEDMENLISSIKDYK